MEALLYLYTGRSQIYERIDFDGFHHIYPDQLTTKTLNFPFFLNRFDQVSNQKYQHIFPTSGAMDANKVSNPMYFLVKEFNNCGFDCLYLTCLQIIIVFQVLCKKPHMILVHSVLSLCYNQPQFYSFHNSKKYLPLIKPSQNLSKNYLLPLSNPIKELPPPIKELPHPIKPTKELPPPIK